MQLVENHFRQNDTSDLPEFALTPEQELNGQITALMSNLDYPPDGDYLRNATASQIAAIWQAVAKDKSWKRFLSQRRGQARMTPNACVTLVQCMRHAWLAHAQRTASPSAVGRSVR